MGEPLVQSAEAVEGNKPAQIRADTIARIVRHDFTNVSNNNMLRPTPQEELVYYTAVVEGKYNIAGDKAIEPLLKEVPLSDIDFQKIQQDPHLMESLSALMKANSNNYGDVRDLCYKAVIRGDGINKDVLLNLRRLVPTLFDFKILEQNLRDESEREGKQIDKKAIEDLKGIMYPEQAERLKIRNYIHQYALRLDEAGGLPPLDGHVLTAAEIQQRNYNIALRKYNTYFKDNAQGTPFITSGKYLWQACCYGEMPPSGPKFKGYLMIDPKDLPTVLGKVQLLGEERAKQNRSLSFKWLAGKLSGNATEEDEDNAFINLRKMGTYSSLQDTMACVVLYSPDKKDIQSMGDFLVHSDGWDDIEKNRIAYSADGRGTLPQHAPRRGNTSAYIDNHQRQFRSFCFNELAGESEDQAGVEQQGDKTVMPGEVADDYEAMDTMPALRAPSSPEVPEQEYDPLIDIRNHSVNLVFTVSPEKKIIFKGATPKLQNYPVLVNKILRANLSEQTLHKKQIICELSNGSLLHIDGQGTVIETTAEGKKNLGKIDTTKRARLIAKEPLQATLLPNSQDDQPSFLPDYAIKTAYVYDWEESNLQLPEWNTSDILDRYAHSPK